MKEQNTRRAVKVQGSSSLALHMMSLLGWASLALTVAIQFSSFLVSYSFGFDKVVDLAGTLNFLVLAVCGLLLNATFFLRQCILTSLVALWSLRLGVFLFLRMLRRKRDSRFDGVRGHVGRLAVFWAVQIAWVWIVSLPVTFTNAARQDRRLAVADYVGWSLWTVGMVCESVADHQKYRFALKSRGTRFLRSGLWRWCRHPNYFGEILLWFGIWLSSSTGLWPASTAALGLASPGLTFFLLAFVSGIPVAERRDDLRYRELVAYREYKHCTSPLWPMPPGLYEDIPWPIKRWVFLDRRIVQARHA